MGKHPVDVMLDMAVEEDLKTEFFAAPPNGKIEHLKELVDDPYVLFGPVYSGSAIVTQTLAKQHEIAEFTGGEAANLTEQKNPYIFRTSFGQQASMPKIANYMRDVVKAKKIAVEFDRKVLYELDGGERRKVKRLKIKVKPEALTVMIPEESA